MGTPTRRAPEAEPFVVERRFIAMGSHSHVIVVAPLDLYTCSADAGRDDARYFSHLGDVALARIQQLERRWSRFLPDSELNELNRAGGKPIRCSIETIALVTKLIDAWELTDGAFDPTMVRALVELGYATGRPVTPHDGEIPQSPARVLEAGGIDAVRFDDTVALRGQPGKIRVDPEAHTVHLPVGTALDAGGLGKGLAADMVADELVTAGASGALVSIGGDLAVRGAPPEGADGWTIDVQAFDDAPEYQVRLASGGVATSTNRLRTWVRDGEEQHHLLDPNTQRPTTSDVLACSVLAGSAATAEVFTKVPFVTGSLAGMTMLERFGLAAMLLTDDGISVTTAWEQFDASHRPPPNPGDLTTGDPS